MSLTHLALLCVTLVVACGGSEFGSSGTADDAQTSTEAAPTDAIGGFDSSNQANETSAIDAPISPPADSFAGTADQLADSGLGDSNHVGEENGDEQASSDATDAR